MATPKRDRPLVCVIDDVPPVIRLLELELGFSGFDVIGVPISGDVYRIVEQTQPDVVVLEVFLPQLSGLELLKGLRQRFDLPVIFLTTSSNDADRTEAFDLGASDYITKPFDPLALSDRLRAVLKQPSPRNRLLKNGDLVIDMMRQAARRGDTHISLSTNDWSVLMALGKEPNLRIAPDELALNVWGLPDEAAVHTVSSWITRLRQRLGDSASKHTIIKGDKDSGYELVAELIEE